MRLKEYGLQFQGVDEDGANSFLPITKAGTDK